MLRNNRLKLILALFGILVSAGQVLLAPPISRAATRLLMPLRPTVRNMFVGQEFGKILSNRYVDSFPDQSLIKTVLLQEAPTVPTDCPNPFVFQLLRDAQTYQAQKAKDLTAEEARKAQELRIRKIQELTDAQKRKAREAYELKIKEEQVIEDLKKTEELRARNAQALKDAQSRQEIEQKRKELELQELIEQRLKEAGIDKKRETYKAWREKAKVVRFLDVEFHASPERFKFLAVACVAVSVLCAIGLKAAFDKICAEIEKKKEALCNRVAGVKAEWEAASNVRLDLQITELKEELVSEKTQIKALTKSRKDLANERTALDAKKTSLVERFSKARNRRKIDKAIDRLTKRIAIAKEVIESLEGQINIKLKERGVQDSWLSKQSGYGSMVKWLKGFGTSLEELKNTCLESWSTEPKRTVLSSQPVQRESMQTAALVRSVVGEAYLPADDSLETMVQEMSDSFKRDSKNRFARVQLNLAQELPTAPLVAPVNEVSDYSWKTKAIVPVIAACCAIVACSKS